jgi:uncharacterized membrane protein YcaP (DUF421 family)
LLQVLSDLSIVALQTFVIYVFLIAAFRLLGHRQISELTPAELVVVMVIGSAVETSLVAGNRTLWAGLTSAATLLTCNWLLSFLIQHWDGLRRIMVGPPVILVYKGQLLLPRMRRLGLTEHDVREGIREQGYDNLDSIKMAVLEIDGVISVVPKEKSADEGEKAG